MDCIFCKIANKEIEANIVVENKYAIAFMDNNPISDGHILVIPKKHYSDWAVCASEYLSAVSELAKSVSYILESSSLDPWGINYLSNQGHVAGQEINHFHLHVIPKYGKDWGLKFSADKKEFDWTPENAYKELTKTAKKLEKKGLFKKLRTIAGE